MLAKLNFLHITIRNSIFYKVAYLYNENRTKCVQLTKQCCLSAKSFVFYDVPNFA